MQRTERHNRIRINRFNRRIAFRPLCPTPFRSDNAFSKRRWWTSVFGDVFFGPQRQLSNAESIWSVLVFLR